MNRKAMLRVSTTLLLGVSLASGPLNLELVSLFSSPDAYAQGKGNGNGNGNGGNGGDNGNSGQGGGQGEGGAAAGGAGGAGDDGNDGGANESGTGGGAGSNGGGGNTASGGDGGGSGGNEGDRGHVRDDPDLVGMALDDQMESSPAPGASEFGHSRGLGHGQNPPDEVAASPSAGPADQGRAIIDGLASLDEGALATALSRLSSPELAAVAAACGGGDFITGRAERVCGAAGSSSTGGSEGSQSSD